MAEPAAVTGRPRRQPEPGCPEQVAGTRELRVTAVFPARKDQVRHARQFAKSRLAGWPLADEAVLIVSELAANAVLHSASRGGGAFWVHLEVFPSQYVWVEVRDEGGLWTQGDHDDERPHGLDIVKELAADSGVDGDAHNGWIVWARLELPKPAAATDVVGDRAFVANGHAAWPGTDGDAAISSRRGRPWCD